MRSGLIDAAVGSTINWSPQVPELNLFSLPFFIPDETLRAVTGGDAGTMVFEAIGSVALFRWPGGKWLPSGIQLRAYQPAGDLDDKSA